MLYNWRGEFIDIIKGMNLDDLTSLSMAMIEARQIFFAGNGGSYGNVTHMAGDMLINSKLEADIHALGDNLVAFSALANDFSYEEAMELEYVRRRRGPSLLILLSTSGKSPNILKLAETAFRNRDVVFSITGSTPANELVKNSNKNIQLQSTDAGLLESAYDLVGHLLIMEVKRLLAQLV